MNFRYKLHRALIIAFLLAPSTAWAGIIVDVSVSGTPGAYSYAYQIENQTDTGLLLFSLTVTGELGSIQAPAGWVTATGIPAIGETLVEWVSTDVPYDVPAFGVLSGFQITSSGGPGSVTFSTLDDNFIEFAGQTTGPVAPAAVPEPGSFFLACVAVAALLASRYWQRRVRSHLG